MIKRCPIYKFTDTKCNPVFINVDDIVAFYYNAAFISTEIRLRNKMTFHVKESCEEIGKNILDFYNSLK